MLFNEVFFFQEEEHISQLEADIRAVQEAALEAADTDSMTGASLLHDDGSIMGECPCLDDCMAFFRTLIFHIF